MLSIPDIRMVSARLLGAEVSAWGQRGKLGDFVTADRAEAREMRRQGPRRILQRFAAAVLERNVTGTSYLRRVEVFERELIRPERLDLGEASRLLKEAHYRFPEQGAATLVEVVQRLTELGFSWPAYLAEAEAKWEQGFVDDPLLSIKGVWLKTRDFALSEFSDCYCAPDLHVCRIIARTGLLLHGYGDPDLSTADYAFMRRLIQRLARQSGWPEAPGALSPSHIDRMLWYYGQDRSRCSTRANCPSCPAADVCLTALGQRTGNRGFGDPGPRH